jgi:DNA end-binding protein Ku
VGHLAEGLHVGQHLLPGFARRLGLFAGVRQPRLVDALGAIDDKIAGKQVVATEPQEAAATGQVIDLMDALRASLGKKPGQPVKVAAPAKVAVEALPVDALAERKPARRATKAVETEVAAPARARASK